jgi:hypothetical protein
MPSPDPTGPAEHKSAALENDRVKRLEFRKPEAEDGAVIRHVRDKLARLEFTAPDNICYKRHLLRVQGLIDSLRAGRSMAVHRHQARIAAGLVRVINGSARSRTLAGL